MFRRKTQNPQINKNDDLEVNISDGKDIKYDEEIPIQAEPNEEESESEDEEEQPHEQVRPKSGIRRPKPLPPPLSHSNSENSDNSDSDDGLITLEPGGTTASKSQKIPGEYNPDKFAELQVPLEVRDLFQYITKYTPQHLNLDYKFKPFVPEYIPGVGDIDAFLKPLSPSLDSSESSGFSGTSGTSVTSETLGLKVLDEPAASQSDSALLHLQLRAVSVTNKDNKSLIIKKIQNVESNQKLIDKWIVDISDLHRTKPPPMVKYTNPMPDIDTLMQEWLEPLELRLRTNGFPSHKLFCSLDEYIRIICAVFDIPLHDTKKIQSLHLLFSLYIAIKNSQLYVNHNVNNNPEEAEINQLILD